MRCWTAKCRIIPHSARVQSPILNGFHGGDPFAVVNSDDSREVPHMDLDGLTSEWVPTPLAPSRLALLSSVQHMWRSYLHIFAGLRGMASTAEVNHPNLHDARISSHPRSMIRLSAPLPPSPGLATVDAVVTIHSVL